MSHIWGLRRISGMQIISVKDNQTGRARWTDRIGQLWRQARSQWLGGRLRRMSLEKKLELASKRKVGRHMLRMLAADPSELVRMTVIKRGDIPALWRITMARGNSINIARAWAKAPVLNDQEVEILIERWAEDPGVGSLLAGREGLEPVVLAQLAERVVNGRVVRRLIRNGVLQTPLGKNILKILLRRWPTLPEDEALDSALGSLLGAARNHLSKAELREFLPGVLKKHPKLSFQVLSRWPSDLLATLDTQVFLEWLASQDPEVGRELSGTLASLNRQVDGASIARSLR